MMNLSATVYNFFIAAIAAEQSQKISCAWPMVDARDTILHQSIRLRERHSHYSAIQKMIIINFLISFPMQNSFTFYDILNVNFQS